MPSLDIPFSTTGNCSSAGTAVDTGYQCSYQCSAGFYARPGTSGTLTCNNGEFAPLPTLVCQRMKTPCSTNLAKHVVQHDSYAHSGDGQWAPWTNTTTCTATCGGGSLSQTRTCTNPAPANGGATCLGASQQTVACNTAPCPVDGNWSGWVNSTACTVTCGGGSLTQTRTCTNPAPANGGLSCPGNSEQTVSCNTQACPLGPGM
jgi:hypothetical protein